MGEASDLSFESGQVILVERQGDDGWWVGRIGDKRGNFPGNYVMPQEEQYGSSDNASSPVQDKNNDASRNTSFQEYQVTALYTYEAQAEGDLPFQANETITVTQKIDDQWLQGRNSYGEVGIFPSNYVS